MNLQYFSEEKTHAATPKKRQEARKRGQVARSQEAGSAAALLTLGIVLKSLGPNVAERLWRLGSSFWDAPPVELTSDGLPALAERVLYEGVSMLLPVFGVVTVVVVSTAALQGGFVFTAVPLRPDFNRLNPLEGAKRLISKRALVEMVKSLVKVVAVALIVYKTVSAGIWDIIGLYEEELLAAIGIVGDMACQIIFRSGFALLLIAGADYAFKRWEHEKGLMMTRQELKEEINQLEGRPELRARIREAQRAMTRMRMMAEVAKADVVITNPTHFAVALSYDAHRMAAPRLVAKGEGHMARRIREKAAKHGVTVVRNAALAQGLYRAVKIGEYIPSEFYKAVAEVLAFVYRLKGRI